MPREDETLRKAEGDDKLSEETRKEVFLEKERSAENEPAHERQYSGSSPPRTVGRETPERGQ